VHNVIGKTGNKEDQRTNQNALQRDKTKTAKQGIERKEQAEQNGEDSHPTDEWRTGFVLLVPTGAVHDSQVVGQARSEPDGYARNQYTESKQHGQFHGHLQHLLVSAGVSACINIRMLVRQRHKPTRPQKRRALSRGALALISRASLALSRREALDFFLSGAATAQAQTEQADPEQGQTCRFGDHKSEIATVGAISACNMRWGSPEPVSVASPTTKLVLDHLANLQPLFQIDAKHDLKKWGGIQEPSQAEVHLGRQDIDVGDVRVANQLPGGHATEIGIRGKKHRKGIVHINRSQCTHALASTSLGFWDATRAHARFPQRAIVAARMGEGGKTAAEGAIHPETLRQKDRSCNELWRAARACFLVQRPPMGPAAAIHFSAAKSLRYMDRGVNSMRVRPFFVSGIHFNNLSQGSDTMQKTVLNEDHRRSGARMVDFGGWEMPLHYGSQIEEHHAVRRDAGMFDVSHMCVVDIDGSR
jgi:hypothetical protein